MIENIKKLDKKQITKVYNELPIKGKGDLDITSEEIMRILNKEPGEYLKDIYNDIIEEVLYKRLDNDNKKITSYILNKYN